MENIDISKIQQEIDESCREFNGRINRDKVRILLNEKFKGMTPAEAAPLWWALQGQLVYNPKYDQELKIKQAAFERDIKKCLS